MKPSIKSLRLSQKVWAVVEDVIAENQVIINFNGDLVRVQNETGKNLRPGQRVLMQVAELRPLKFKLLNKAIYPRTLDLEA